LEGKDFNSVKYVRKNKQKLILKTMLFFTLLEALKSSDGIDTKSLRIL